MVVPPIRSSAESPALGIVGQLCKTAARLQREKEELEELLKEKSDELQDYIRVQIPEAMSEVGISKLSLDDGSEVKLELFVSAKIPGPDEELGEGEQPEEPPAFTWLRERGDEDIIKHKIEVWYAKGEDDKAKKVIETLKKMGAPVVDKMSIHSSTLKAYVKRSVAGGVAVPLDMFGAWIGTIAKIVPPKTVGK